MRETSERSVSGCFVRSSDWSYSLVLGGCRSYSTVPGGSWNRSERGCTRNPISLPVKATGGCTVS